MAIYRFLVIRIIRMNSYIGIALMKKDIHPKYFDKAEVTCACGNTFTIGSTVEKLRVEICSACHPFYTGNEKVMDTAGMVEKFKGRVAKSKAVKAKKTSKASKEA